MPIKGNKIFFEFDPIGDKKLSASDKREALDAVADYVREQVLEYVAGNESPVSGGKWKKTLSKKYKAFKEAEGGTGIPNMELYGNMLDKLDVVKVGNKLSLQITGKEAEKADGHNNHSGDSKLPERRFIPDKDQTFKRDILQGINQIVDSFDEIQEPIERPRAQQTKSKSLNQLKKEFTKEIKIVNPTGESATISLQDLFYEL